MKESEQIKLATAAYWKANKRCPIVSIECKNADVLVVAKNLYTIETEVKVTKEDLSRELTTKRYKHWQMARGEAYRYTKARRFYFVVPERLVDDAVEILSKQYPYAGLLVFHYLPSDLFYPGKCITEIKRAKALKAKKIDLKTLFEISGISTNNLLKFASLFGKETTKTTTTGDPRLITYSEKRYK